MTQSRSTLHWLTVLVVAMQFVIDWTMPDVHKDTQPVSLIAWHLGLARRSSP
jgi:cytochrome b561